MKGLIAVCLLIAICVSLGPNAYAGDETLTKGGTYQDWDVFRLQRGEFVSCYAATVAARFHPRTNSRERPVLYVARYPAAASDNTVEIRFGGPVTEFQSVSAKLVARRKPPRDTFPITVKNQNGFISAPADQTSLLKAMQKGRELVIVSQPGVGDILEDRYSLYGFTKATKALDDLCPGPQPPPAEAQSDGGNSAAVEAIESGAGR